MTAQFTPLLLIALCGTSLSPLVETDATSQPPHASSMPSSSGASAETELAKKGAANILGKWKDEDYGGIAEVKQSGNIFTGTLLSTPLEGVKPGTIIFRELKYEAKKNLWRGKVYAPRRDSEYDATWRIEGNTMKMKVTFGPLWKTVKWYRQ